MQFEDWGFLGSIITAFLVLIGWQKKTNSELHKRVNDSNKALSDHKLEDVKSYPTKAEFKTSIDEIKTVIEKGFEKLENKLDRKADK